MAEVAVTGGAGFIGSWVVRRLLEEGYTVKVIDDLSTGDIQNLPDHPRLRFMRHDITVPDGLDRHFTDTETVIHLAAVSSVPECEANPARAFQVNVKGLENVLNSSVRNSVKKIVFTSSAAVYGNVEGELVEETPPKPVSVYGHTKLLGETLLEYSSLSAVVFRIFNVYGRASLGKGPVGVVDRFLFEAKNGRPLEIYGDGQAVRDFIHVGDVAQAIMLAVKKDVEGLYNIATGRPTTIAELANLVLKLSNQTKVVMHPPRQGDIKYSLADISKAVRELGFKPTMTLERYIGEQTSRWKGHGSVC